MPFCPVVSSHSVFRTVFLSSSALALVLAVCGTALADGGSGSHGAPGGTSSSTGVGGDGADDLAGGGGGGAGTTGGNGGAGAGGAGGAGGASSNNSGLGNNGGVGSGGGGGGGAGGGGGGGGSHGYYGSGSSSLPSVPATNTGGAGGAGGGGGAGGYGLVLENMTGSVVVTADATGGNGGVGYGTGGLVVGVTGGSGGKGLEFSGANLTVSGTVTGGNGGSGFGNSGAGGVGAVFSGTGSTLITSGSIAGGLSGGASPVQANAVEILGNGNILELQAGYSFTGNVVNAGTNTTLSLGGANDATFNLAAIKITASATYGTPEFIGFDSLNKTGTSTWTLTGVNTYTGDTTVEGGTLINTGAISGSVSVRNGATLTGSGTVLGASSIGGRLMGTGRYGDTILLSGSTIAPGNSIGSLTINGNLTFNAGSVYEVEIDASGASDLILVTGTTTLSNGSTALVVPLVGGVYTPGTQWTILTSAGGVTGTFAPVNLSMPYVDIVASYDANNVYLNAQMKTTGTGSVTSFALPGFTRNQTHTAKGADPLGVGHPLYNAIASQMSFEAAAYAFDQLSGEGHASTRTTLLEDSRFVRDAAFERLAHSAREGNNLNRYNAWGKVYGSWGNHKGDGNAASLKRNIGGFFTGIDGYVLDNTLVGVLAGYSRSDVKAHARAFSGTIDNYHLGLYAGTSFEGFNVRGGGAYAWHNMDASRIAAFPGFYDRLTSDYDAHTLQAFGELSYRFDIKNSLGSFSLEPFAQLAYVDVKVDSFRERGGYAALRQFSSGSDNTFTTLGVRKSFAVAFGNDTNLTVNSLIGWRHAFGDENPSSTFAFATGNSGVFLIEGTPIAKNAAVIEAGMDYKLNDSMNLSLNYSGQFAKGVQDNAIKGGFNWRF